MRCGSGGDSGRAAPSAVAFARRFRNTNLPWSALPAARRVRGHHAAITFGLNESLESRGVTSPDRGFDSRIHSSRPGQTTLSESARAARRRSPPVRAGGPGQRLPQRAGAMRAGRFSGVRALGLGLELVRDLPAPFLRGRDVVRHRRPGTPPLGCRLKTPPGEAGTAAPRRLGRDPLVRTLSRRKKSRPQMIVELGLGAAVLARRGEPESISAVRVRQLRASACASQVGQLRLFWFRSCVWGGFGCVQLQALAFARPPNDCRTRPRGGGACASRRPRWSLFNRSPVAARLQHGAGSSIGEVMGSKRANGEGPSIAKAIGFGVVSSCCPRASAEPCMRRHVVRSSRS